ncbi:MAG: hypothetical protein ACLFSU_02605 [Acholeplasmataceae bacterium]
MKKARYGYGWLLKFILAAILLGMGIYMVLADEVVYMITGITILIFSVLRVYPLMKSLTKEVLRTINLIEIIFDLLIGVLIIYVAATRDLADETIWRSVYRFSLGFVFYARALVFFNSVVFLGEKTEVAKFWAHIGFITLATIILSTSDFDYEMVGMFFLIVSLLGAIYLGFDGYGGYRTYRSYQFELNKGQTKTKEKGIEMPDEIEEDERDRPYVN